MQLNRRADALRQQALAARDELRIALHACPSGAQVIDFGVAVPGGLAAGRMLARVCLADLADVTLASARPELGGGPAVMVATDHPVAACLAAQYAGWQITGGAAEKPFFAMGSGPMRAAAGREGLFDRIGLVERAERAVGVLEAAKLPPPDVCAQVAEMCGLASDRLTLLVAPTASQAGTVQIVARSVETALHKLLELGYDVRRVESGLGIAPLPPVAGDDLAAIGRTNDAILYGAEVTLWVRDSDDALAAVGPQVPSCASADHGRTFAEIFADYGHDFYKIDPLLFSPAVVTLINLSSGRVHRFGRLEPELVGRSFGG